MASTHTTPHTGRSARAAAPDGRHELHRRCVFELDLSCGHCLTVELDGWYPVSVTCCDRLGGIWYNGSYVSFASNVDYARCLQERYEQRPAGAAGEPLRTWGRRARTDNPVPPDDCRPRGSAGRFPARVGGPVGSATTGR